MSYMRRCITYRRKSEKDIWDNISSLTSKKCGRSKIGSQQNSEMYVLYRRVEKA